jgi:hypothetical protein
VKKFILTFDELHRNKDNWKTGILKTTVISINNKEESCEVQIQSRCNWKALVLIANNDASL